MKLTEIQKNLLLERIMMEMYGPLIKDMLDDGVKLEDITLEKMANWAMQHVKLADLHGEMNGMD